MYQISHNFVFRLNHCIYTYVYNMYNIMKLFCKLLSRSPTHSEGKRRLRRYYLSLFLGLGCGTNSPITVISKPFSLSDQKV